MAPRSLHNICEWLASTSLSRAIQDAAWAVPTIQILHILSIAAALSPAVLVDLKLLGLTANGRSVQSVASKYMPIVWIALTLLLLSGSALVVAEPSRELESPSFQLKMLLLLFNLTITAVIHRLSMKPPTQALVFTNTLRKPLALVSLCLWASIVFAGRWIAYSDAGS